MSEGDSVGHSGGGQIALAGRLQPAISLKHLSKQFGAQSVLTDINLDIPAGELLVILGASGSGKTTLLRIVAGLEPSDAGEVWLNGRVVNHLPPQSRRMGVVFQDQALFRYMTIEQNIAFGLRLRKITGAKAQRIVDELLEMIRLEAHRRKYPRHLSGGERQRVAIARALAYGPAVVLLDEPFSALDPVTRTDLRREMRQLLKERKATALFITHDQEEALEMADRIAILNRGHIEQVGTPHEIYNHPGNEFVATFLGAANVLLGQWREGHVSVGALRLKAPPETPPLSERQPVKAVFRPEDVAINFQAQFLDTPFYLGSGIVEDISYVGPTERLTVQLQLWPAPKSAARPGNPQPRLLLVDETYAESFPIRISRTKWEASEMELSPGDAVVLGLKNYLLLPHYPLQTESGAKVVR